MLLFQSTWRPAQLALLVGLSLPRLTQAGDSRPAPPGPDDSVRVLYPHRRPVFQLDIRNSIANNHFITVPGLKLGVEWRGRLRTGVGIYLLSNGVPSRRPIPNELPANTRAEVRLRYVAGYGEYVVLGNPRWEVATQLQLGVGKTYARFTLPDGSDLRSSKKIIWLVEPSAAAQLRIFRWLSLGTGAGWRQPVFVDAVTQRELNGPVFYGRVKLALGDLYKIFRDRQPLFTQEGLRRIDW